MGAEQDDQAAAVVPSAFDGPHRNRSDCLNLFLAHTADAVLVHQDGWVVYINRAGTQLLRARDANKVLGRHVSDLSPALAALTPTDTSLPEPTSTVPRTPVTIRRLTGEMAYTEAFALTVRWSASPAVAVLLREPTNDHHVHASAGAADDRLRAVIAALPDAIVVVDHHGQVQFSNPAANLLFRGHLTTAINLTDPSLYQRYPLYDVDGEQLPRWRRPLTHALQTGTATHDIIGADRSNGQRVWMAVTCTPLTPGSDSSPFVISLTDVTEHRTTADELSYRATHDQLTGLPNRAHTIATLDYYLRARHRRDPLAVMFIDLDDLKTTNDTFGHAVGDLILRTSARRLRQALPATATLGRLGGDEFVAVQLDDIDELSNITTNLHTALAQPITIAGHNLHIHASIGVVLVPPRDTRTTDHILRRADHAMYRAKTTGGARTHYLTTPPAQPFNGYVPQYFPRPHDHPTEPIPRTTTSQFS
ncbi:MULTISPECIES: sensor domain-containing diguanylate cyclase [Actinomycetes]|uniref:sensor domain-containing diguanylate cyclase n=1 Tax=Actinomycetes TaxID=1760 RepID=UPI0004BF08B4|nr:MULTISPECIES: sensor domain-containing diguanylate cyclase [Actinomycetes]